MRRAGLPVLRRTSDAPTRLERRHALARLGVAQLPEFYDGLDRELLDETMSVSPSIRARGFSDLCDLIYLRLVQLVDECREMRLSARWRDDWLDAHIADALVTLGELPACWPLVVVAARLSLTGGASRLQIENLFHFRQRTERAAA